MLMKTDELGIPRFSNQDLLDMIYTGHIDKCHVVLCDPNDDIEKFTKNLEGLEVDFPFRVPDADALEAMFKMVETEGLYLGGSAGINVAGAVELAKVLGPGHTIVTILCDSGSRYLSKLYNRNFLVNNDLPCPDWV